MKKNINNKKAKFYCENCGEIVSQNAKVCTKCGRFFSSVRCPRCGRVGTNDDFVNGCKDCGYAFTPTKNIKQKHFRTLGIKGQQIEKHLFMKYY